MSADWRGLTDLLPYLSALAGAATGATFTLLVALYVGWPAWLVGMTTDGFPEFHRGFRDADFRAGAREAFRGPRVLWPGILSGGVFAVLLLVWDWSVGPPEDFRSILWVTARITLCLAPAMWFHGRVVQMAIVHNNKRTPAEPKII